MVVGPKEAESDSVALRDRLEGDLGSKPLSEVIAMLSQEVTERKIRQVATPQTPAPEPTSSSSHEY
jgi:threonyl-tRNA synthetase